MEVVVIWLIMAGVVAVIANSKGFDTSGWFIYGALLWPIALAHVIVKPSAAVTRQASRPTKKCPECAEMVLAEAQVCRFCGNRSFPVDEDEPYVPRPQPTAWQKLWWNPHAPDRRR